MSNQNLVLRTVYISPAVDDVLRVQAFDKRTSKNDLIRKYLELGMKAANALDAKATVVRSPTLKKEVAKAKATPAKSPSSAKSLVAPSSALVKAKRPKSAIVQKA